MKNYMFVVPSLSKGGAERVVSVLASGLAEKGYTVSILRYFKTDADYSVSEKVNVITLSQNESDYDRMSKFVLFYKMHKVFKEHNPDYIIPFLRRVNIQTVLASFGYFKRIVYTVRVSPYIDGGMLGKIHAFLINHTNKTIVQNNEQKEFYDKNVQKRIYILPNPVNEQFLETQTVFDHTKEFRVISSGRLTKQKNFSMLIKAFSKFSEQKENVYLDIYGEGEEKENLQALVDSLNMQKRIMLKGRINDLPNVYKKASLYVMSSNYEGMPNALLEAMAIGLPCVSTDCKTGPKEMIRNGENGLLVPTNDEGELLEALNFMFNNKDEAIKMGKNARKDVFENYTVEKIVDKFLVFFS